VKFVFLHEINSAICALREHSGMPPISDPLPPALNAFLVVKQTMFPDPPAQAETNSS
jgi:hypothetical protein